MNQGQAQSVFPAAPFRPLSSAAVGGLVCSLIVFVPFLTQFVGFILGIIGITRTGAGRLRGRGLAVAAVFISPLVGLVWLFIAGAFVAMLSLADAAKEAQVLFRADPANVAQAVSTLREKAFSERLKLQVDDEALAAFVNQVRETYGRPKSFTYVGTNRGIFGGVNVRMDVNFANETRQVTLKMGLAGPFRTKTEIDNIQVGDYTLLPSQ